jgi:hypothetical protein
MHYVKRILFCQVESLRPRDPPPVWIVFAFAIWGFISMIGCAVNMAQAVPLLKGSASERPSVPRRNLVQHAEFLIVSMNVADSRMAELFGQPIGSDWRQSKGVHHTADVSTCGRLFLDEAHAVPAEFAPSEISPASGALRPPGRQDQAFLAHGRLSRLLGR